MPVSTAAASPEDEIARINRVRADLFEELVKTRADTASARAQLDAAIKARDAAEAELARLKAAASANAANAGLSAETKAEPQQSAPNATPSDVRRQSVRPAAPRATRSVQRTAGTSTQQRGARTNHSRGTVAHQTNQRARQTAPVARVQELPSVLRLQTPQ